jgi:hypothetical protein
MNNKRFSKSKVGQQGVSLAITELLERELNPYLPVVDDHGVDIMLASGARIQVKAAHLSKLRRDRHRQYRFSCQQNVYGSRSAQRAIYWQRRKFAKQCDFLVLVGLDERRFWIVPAIVADERTENMLVLGQSSGPTMEEIQKLADQGKELQDIAYELGCCVTTVWKRRKGIREDRGKKIRALRAYENRWDLLIDFNKPRLINGANDVPTVILPTIYERDPDFVATLAGSIPAAA